MSDSRRRPVETDVRITISPKSYTWPDGNETTYIPVALIGKDRYAELVCRGETSRIIQRAGANVGWTLHVKGVILPHAAGPHHQTRIGADSLSQMRPPARHKENPAGAPEGDTGGQDGPEQPAPAL